MASGYFSPDVKTRRQVFFFTRRQGMVSRYFLPDVKARRQSFFIRRQGSTSEYFIASYFSLDVKPWRQGIFHPTSSPDVRVFFTRRQGPTSRPDVRVFYSQLFFTRRQGTASRYFSPDLKAQRKFFLTDVNVRRHSSFTRRQSIL